MRRTLCAAALALTALGACTVEEAGGSASSNADEPAGAAAGGQDVYTVGQTAHTGDMDVTVHTVTDPWTSGNMFETPQPGHRFVAVEMEVVNTSDQPLTLSSILMAEMTDAQNRPWDAAFAGSELPKVEGDVQPGQARRGWMVFEVAQDSTDLRVRIKGNLTATGSLFQL